MLLLGVRTLRQAMQMRAIRNDARHFMTRDQTRIRIARQVKWFYNVYKPMLSEGLWECFLATDGRFVVGYGQVRKMHGKWWVTGIIKKEHRGQGYGRKLFAALTANAARRSPGGAVWLEVLKSNIRARTLYESLGYSMTAYVTTDNREIIVMVKETQ